MTRLFMTRRSTFSQNSQKALESAADFFAGLEDGLDRVAANVLNGGEAEADCLARQSDMRA